MLLYGRDCVLPLDTVLTPRRRYYGEDYVPTMFQRLHAAFLHVADNTKHARQEIKRQEDKRARQRQFVVGDPVYLHDPVVKEGQVRKFKSPWKPYYRIVEMMSPVTAIIRCQKDGQSRSAHVNNLRYANINVEWDFEDSPDDTEEEEVFPEQNTRRWLGPRKRPTGKKRGRTLQARVGLDGTYPEVPAQGSDSDTIVEEQQEVGAAEPSRTVEMKDSEDSDRKVSNEVQGTEVQGSETLQKALDVPIESSSNRQTSKDDKEDDDTDKNVTDENPDQDQEIVKKPVDKPQEEPGVPVGNQALIPDQPDQLDGSETEILSGLSELDTTRKTTRNTKQLTFRKKDKGRAVGTGRYFLRSRPYSHKDKTVMIKKVDRALKSSSCRNTSKDSKDEIPDALPEQPSTSSNLTRSRSEKTKRYYLRHQLYAHNDDSSDEATQVTPTVPKELATLMKSGICNKPSGSRSTAVTNKETEMVSSSKVVKRPPLFSISCKRVHSSSDTVDPDDVSDLEILQPLRLGRIERDTDGSARPDDAPNVPQKDGTISMDDVNQVCVEVSTVSNKSTPCAQGIAELIQDLPIVDNFTDDKKYFSCNEYI